MNDAEFQKWATESGLRNDHLVIPKGTVRWIHNHGMRKAAIARAIIIGGPMQFDMFYEFPNDSDLPFSITRSPGTWEVEFEKPIATDIHLDITSAEPLIVL